MVRLSNNGNALQHITYYGDEKLDLLDTPSVRRILIELIVKDSLAKRIMPKPLANMLEGGMLSDTKSIKVMFMERL